MHGYINRSVTYGTEIPAGLKAYMCIHFYPGQTDKAIMWLYHSSGGHLINNKGTFATNSTLYIENSTLRDNTLVDKGLSNWKAHLAKHPLVVMTYLAEPIERDLTPEEIQAYKNLVTYAGTTILADFSFCCIMTVEGECSNNE